MQDLVIQDLLVKEVVRKDQQVEHLMQQQTHKQQLIEMQQEAEAVDHQVEAKSFAL